jgi:hypothetical protein
MVSTAEAHVGAVRHRFAPMMNSRTGESAERHAVTQEDVEIKGHPSVRHASLVVRSSEGVSVPIHDSFGG